MLNIPRTLQICLLSLLAGVSKYWKSYTNAKKSNKARNSWEISWILIYKLDINFLYEAKDEYTKMSKKYSINKMLIL